jgi:hypothetical protein
MTQSLAEAESYRLNVDYYGADFPVDLLVRRMEEGDFIIPGFQREYLWKQEEASRFIESLMIGLPTPALFLAKDKFSNRYLVIDGQQRLKTLQHFYNGEFGDGKKFELKSVAPSLTGLAYSTLSLSDRRALDNSIIHCIIISDNYDPRGMFHLFERLNTTGTPLTAQEVRNAVYHGRFSTMLHELSTIQEWRDVYGRPAHRAEEEELILRFLALHFAIDEYKGSMADFLNGFMLSNKDLEEISGSKMEKAFLETVGFLGSCIGPQVFFHRKSFSRVLFDSLMLLTARELGQGMTCEVLKGFHETLINDRHFWSMSQHATTNRSNLLMRLHYVDQLFKTARSAL